MRAFLRISTFCLLSLTLAGTAARADELLVMSYSCAVIGGQPVLTRSREDEGHRIIGRREQRTFSACSPSEPDMCRQWIVHRFDLDCGGVRVPWMSVVAAANARRRGGAWIENGRLLLQMPPRWAGESDDPCADWLYEEGRRASGRFTRNDRYCADREALGWRPAAVAMPAGFAPMLGIDGVFVASTAPRQSAPPPAPPVAQVPAPPKVARVEPLPPPTADVRDAPAKETPAKEPPAKKQPAPRADAQPAVPPPVQSAPSPAPSPGAPVVPRIINRIDPAPPGPAPAPTPRVPVRPEAAAPPPEPPREPKVIPPAPVKEARPRSEPPSPPQAATPETDKSIAVSLVSAMYSPTAVAAFAAAGFAMLVMAAFAYMRQRERTQLGGTAARDIASVSLDGRPARAEDAGPRAVVRARPQPIVPRAPPPLPLPAQPEAASTPASWGDAIPQTRDEALQVLGMGVRPDATEAAIKKIVDGLRLSWHPDHAHGPADLQLRELRLKQINAAWEIIAGKRAEA